MSYRAGAKVMDNVDDLLDGLEVDLDVDVLEPALVIGEPLDGAYMFITVHTCPHCKAKMQTIGAGHAVYNCSWCAGKRGRNVEMQRTYEPLEVME
jgi:hypothetical protein